MARLALELYLLLESFITVAAVHDSGSTRMLGSEQHVLSVAIDRKGKVSAVSAATMRAETGMAPTVPPGNSASAIGPSVGQVYREQEGSDPSALLSASAPPMPMPAAVADNNGAAATSALSSPTAIKTAAEGANATVQSHSNAAMPLVEPAAGIAGSAQTSSTPPTSAVDSGGIAGSAQTSSNPPNSAVDSGGQPKYFPNATFTGSPVSVGSQSNITVNSTATVAGNTDDEAKLLVASVTRKVVIMMAVLFILLVCATIVARHARNREPY